jgi:polar amino acid transport system permease protein
MEWQIRGLNIKDLLLMLEGAVITIELSAIAIILGLVLAMIVGVLRTSKIKIISGVSRIYVELFRGTPVLMQIFLFYYGLRLLDVHLPALLSASLAYIFYFGAAAGETYKGILEAIPKSQWEASASLGFSYINQLRYIIIPQFIRTAIPPTMGIIVGLIKYTSLASIVGFVELTRMGSKVMTMTMNPFTAFPIVAALYFIICFPLTFYSRRLEKKLIR